MSEPIGYFLLGIFVVGAIISFKQWIKYDDAARGSLPGLAQRRRRRRSESYRVAAYLTLFLTTVVIYIFLNTFFEVLIVKAIANLTAGIIVALLLFTLKIFKVFDFKKVFTKQRFDLKNVLIVFLIFIVLVLAISTLIIMLHRDITFKDILGYLFDKTETGHEHSTNSK